MALVEFECRSGIAGNLWLAAFVGLGAQEGLIRELPEALHLPFVSVRTAVESNGAYRPSVSIEGTALAGAETYSQMLGRISDAGLPPDVEANARRVMEARQRAESAARGLALEGRTFDGDAMADTLLDVVGGVLLWFDLGKPAITTRGPVVLGGKRPPAVSELLGAIPTTTGPADLELTTPTGAALLGHFWEPVEAEGEPLRRAEVRGDFSSPGLTDELGAALFP